MSLAISTNSIDGRIAIGEKHEKGYPIKLDYFIFTLPFDPKTKTAPKNKKMTEIMKEKYKTDKPKYVDVVLIDHHPNEAFFTNYMNYPNNICNCRGNGECAIRNMPDGTKKEVACNYDTCEYRWIKGSKGIINTCKPTGILSFIIPESPISGGIWRFVTHSKMTIGRINGSLEKFYQTRKTLFGLKIRLRVTIVQVKVEGGQQNVPIVETEIPFSYLEIAAGAGTAIGTLAEAKQQYQTLGMGQNLARIQELSIQAEAEGFDGSTPAIDLKTPSEKVQASSIIISQEVLDF